MCGMWSVHSCTPNTASLIVPQAGLKQTNCLIQQVEVKNSKMKKDVIIIRILSRSQYLSQSGSMIWGFEECLHLLLLFLY